MSLEICSSIYGEVDMSNTIYKVERLRFWCNKILPLVYDESLSYYELLCKVTQKLNELIEQNNKIADEMGEYIAYWLTTPEGQAIMQEVITETIDQNYQNLVTRMGEAESDISTLETKILRAPIINMNGGNIVFFGDSWTVGGSASTTDDRWTTKVARALKLNEYNYGVGGGGFAISNKIITGVNTASSAMTTAQKNNTTLAVITGGVNDDRHWSEQSVTVDLFYQGVVDVISAVHSAFPNALIVLGIGNTVQHGTANTYKHAIGYTNRYIGNRSYPIRVVDNVLFWVSNTDWYRSDGLHLSDTGHTVFADYMTNAILGGNTNVNSFMGAVNWDSDYVSSQAGGPAHIWRYNERFVINSVDLTFNGEFTGNHAVASVPEYLAPRQNVYQNVYYGNVVAGTIAITAAGNIRIIANDSLTNAYTPELTWLAY